MAEELVTIATFDFPTQAEAERLLLEQEGIRTFLADDNLVGMDWFVSNAVGGAKLQVAAQDADRARKLLDEYRTLKADVDENLSGKEVTFACQGCGKSITFPGERCGHVEVCPHCGSYVDVPDDMANSSSTQPEATVTRRMRVPAELDGAGETRRETRPTWHLWLEVAAVLCLAYLPWFFYAVAEYAGWCVTSWSFLYRELSLIVTSLEVSLPILVILWLSKVSWASFGIVRPKWPVDAFFGGAIWGAAFVARDIAMHLLPTLGVRQAVSLDVANKYGPHGVPAYFLLPISVVACAFAEELVCRGYLITRLETLLRSKRLAILITSAMFASYHVYQGLTPLLGHFAVGVVYGISFCMIRRLWPLCIAHATWNFFVLL
jgi:membrane protease YdiL (CAAX protease family)